MTRGRKPKKLTDDQRAQVEALAAYLTQGQIADYFGIGERTFRDMMDREPDISAAYKRGKAKAIGAVAQNLIKKARDGDNACMMFYLKTQAGWRETTHLEHSGPDGGPIQTEDVLDVSKLSDAALAELHKALKGDGSDPA